MKLSERHNCSVIGNRVYSKWRENGVAFEMRDVEYERSNRTLASGAVFFDLKKGLGEKTMIRGYFGDCVIGPFLAYGIRTVDVKEDYDWFKKQNKQHRHGVVEVAKANVTKMMQALVDGAGIVDNYKENEINDSTNSHTTKVRFIEISINNRMTLILLCRLH